MSVQREPITPPVEPSFLLQLHVFKSDSLETLLRRYGYNEQEKTTVYVKVFTSRKKTFCFVEVCLSVCMYVPDVSMFKWIIAAYFIGCRQCTFCFSLFAGVPEQSLRTFFTFVEEQCKSTSCDHSTVQSSI